MQEIKLGPVMPQEGDILASLVAMVEPRTVVEFGFQTGVSTRYLLTNLPENGHIISFDPSPKDYSWINEPESRDKITLLLRGQETITPTDVSNMPVDFVFFDGAHSFDLNVAAYERLSPMLSDKALIVVHDTGAWNTHLFDDGNFGYLEGKYRVHQPAEVQFASWLKERGLQRIDLTPRHVVRHGLSIFQVNTR